MLTHMFWYFSTLWKNSLYARNSKPLNFLKRYKFLILQFAIHYYFLTYHEFFQKTVSMYNTNVNLLIKFIKLNFVVEYPI